MLLFYDDTFEGFLPLTLKSHATLLITERLPSIPSVVEEEQRLIADYHQKQLLDGHSVDLQRPLCNKDITV